MRKPFAPARIELLGPVRVVRDVVIPIAGRQQSSILSLLVLRRGRALSSAEIIQGAWGQHPPDTAAAAMRVHLAKLRAAVSVNGANALPHLSSGYTLERELVTTDLDELDDLTSALATTADPGTALALVDRALALRRGAPFGGLAESEDLRIEAARLEERFLDLEDLRIRLRLDAGQHLDVCAETAALVAAQPLREERTRLLMLALYRSGRQADALTAYRTLRDRLQAELGVDPSAPTRQMEVLVLRQEPELAAPAGPGTSLHSLRRPAITVPHARSSKALVELVGQRLATLDEATVQLVRAVAALGPYAHADLLARVLRLPAPQLAGTLRAATEAGLISPPTIDGLVPLVRAEFAPVLVEPDWSEVHSTVGRVLRDHADGSLAGEVRSTWHLLAGAGGGCVDDQCAAQRAASRSADACLQAGAAEIAEEITAAALELECPDARARLDLLTVRLRALSVIDRSDEAYDCWVEAVAIGREGRDPERFALALLAMDWGWRSVASAPTTTVLLEEALERLGEGASALRLRLRSALLLELALYRSGEPEVQALAEEVTAEADAMGDPESQATALHVKHVLLRGTADLEARTRLARELTALAARTGEPWWEARALVSVLFDEFARGRLAEVPRLSDALADSARRVGSARLSWHHALVQVAYHRERGDLATAASWADEVMVKGSIASIPDAGGATALQQVLNYYHKGSLAPLAPLLVGYVAQQPDNMLAPAIVALALAQAGDTAAAWDHLRSAGRLAQSFPRAEVGPVAAGFAAEAASVLMAASGPASSPPDQRDLLTLLSERLAPFRGQFLVFGQVSATLGPADRCLALLADAVGSTAEAAGLWESALRAAQAAGMPLWCTRIEREASRVVRPHG